MKHTIIFFLFFVSSLTALMAQSVRTDYFLSNSQTRSSMNPAFRPYQGYIGIPLLSDISAGVYTNSMNMNNLVFSKDGRLVTFMHPSVSSDEFLSNIKDNNYVAFDLGCKILSAGWYNKSNGFWTVDLGVRATADVGIPKSLFELIKVGFSQDETQSINYQIEKLRASGTAYAELGAGYSQSLLEDRLLVGAKAKLLLGAADLNLLVDRMLIGTETDGWVARAKATIEGSMTGIRTTYDADGDFEFFKADGVGISGYGLGFDLGGAYSLLDNRARVSLAFTDLGFISWSADNSVNLTSPDTEVHLKLGNYTIGEENTGNQLGSVEDDLKEAINFKENSKKGRNTSLRTNMNIGVEYEVWEKNLSVGLLSSTYFGINTISEFTLSANYMPAQLRWLSAAVSYSFVHNKFNTVGLALHLTPRRGVNFFIASDYLVPQVSGEGLPINNKAANLQFGISIPLTTVTTY
jgi:hypothetical protein